GHEPAAPMPHVFVLPGRSPVSGIPETSGNRHGGLRKVEQCQGLAGRSWAFPEKRENSPRLARLVTNRPKARAGGLLPRCSRPFVFSLGGPRPFFSRLFNGRALTLPGLDAEIANDAAPTLGVGLQEGDELRRRIAAALGAQLLHQVAGLGLGE